MIEIAANASLPVCRIVSWRKFRFEQGQTHTSTRTGMSRWSRRLTSLPYQVLGRRALEEDAPTVAEVMALIAHKAYHGSGSEPSAHLCGTGPGRNDCRRVACRAALSDARPTPHARYEAEFDRHRARRCVSKRLVSEKTLSADRKGLSFLPD